MKTIQELNKSKVPIVILDNTQATRHIVLFGIGNSEDLSADLLSAIHIFFGLKTRR